MTTPVNLIEGDYTMDRAGTLALDYLRKSINELDEPNRTKFRLIVAQAKEAGRSFAISEQVTQRRYEIGRGLLLLAKTGQLDNDLVTGIISHVTGKQYGNAGEGAADMTAQDAARFASICAGILCGTFDIEYISKSNKFLVKEVI